MSVERGIVVSGAVLEGTERVLREPGSGWAPGEIGCRPRKGHRADQLVGHWTAGRPRTGPTTGARVVSAMKARLRSDGSRLDVGVHFVIGADGMIWQACDLALATTHVGHRPTILRSIGVETCWPGTLEQARKLGVTVDRVVVGRARGQKIECMAPPDDLVAAWCWLAEALCRAQHPQIALPRRLAPDAGEAGALEHRDMPGSTKVDAAGLLVGALGF